MRKSGDEGWRKEKGGMRQRYEEVDVRNRCRYKERKMRTGTDTRGLKGEECQM